jgi:hypothetical protein
LRHYAASPTSALFSSTESARFIVECAIDGTRFKLNSAAAVDHHVRVQSKVADIERAVFDAVMQRQTHKVDLLDRSLLQIMCKTGVTSMGVVEKRTVAGYTQQKVRDREDALASTRAACAPQTTAGRLRGV